MKEKIAHVERLIEHFGREFVKLLVGLLALAVLFK
jgi:hypothetical protein